MSRPTRLANRKLLSQFCVLYLGPEIYARFRVVNFGLGVVVRSENTLYKAGDHVAGLLSETLFSRH